MTWSDLKTSRVKEWYRQSPLKRIRLTEPYLRPTAEEVAPLRIEKDESSSLG
jgi:hypothetical protein